jgi:predicted nucleic acid-binding protein
MTSSIDTNIIVALWRMDHPANQVAVNMLSAAHEHGGLVVSAPVYAELMADPNRTERDLQEFISESGISVEWKLEEEIWREAGRAYRDYARRRIRSGGGPPRRILADFVIGAHAVLRGYTLLTLNGRDYAAVFPKLVLVSP